MKLNFTSTKTALRNKRRWVIVLVAALVPILGFTAFRMVNGAEVEYFTAEAVRGDIRSIVNATGTIDAVTTVDVGSQVSGQIAELNADFNSHVTKGQIVARIDPAPFEGRILQVEADLASAEAGLRSLEADVESAKANQQKTDAALREAELNRQRTKELFDQGIASQQQMDALQVAYETALANQRVAAAQINQLEARIEQQKAQIKQRRAALANANLDLQHTIIRSPIDGTVIARNVDIGQTVAASFQAPTLFTIAQDLTQMLVYAKTDESDVGRIPVGADVTFKVDSFPGEEFHGRVKQVRMNPSVVQNVVTYDTIIEFENAGSRLLPGMTAYVTIPVASALDVVKIPNGALRYKPAIPDEQRTALMQKYGLLQPKTNDKDAGVARAQESGNGGRREDGESSSQDRQALRERFRNMSPAERARLRQQFAERRGQGGPGRGNQSGRSGSQKKEEYQIVWKLDPDQALQPVRVKTGITDFAYTAALSDEIKEGDVLIIGQSGGQPGENNSGLTGRMRYMMRRF